MQLFLLLAVLFVSVQGKCRSKCKEETLDCLALHGQDAETRILNACVKTKAASQGDSPCQKCQAESEQNSPTPANQTRQFICLAKCKWVAIHCTQAGVNASNLLELMRCVSSSYTTPLNKAKAPQCGPCILTGECSSYCNKKKGGEVPCSEKEISDVISECQEWKNSQDICPTHNRKSCENLPICSLCNGDCQRSDKECKAEVTPAPEPTQEPQKPTKFASKDDYFRYCKREFSGKENKAKCTACGGKTQRSKGGCKVRPNKAACNKIRMAAVCQMANCKASFNDKEKTDFKRCVNPTDPNMGDSVFGPPKQKGGR